MPKTFANVEDLIRDVDYKPQTSIEEGIKQFLNWFKEYYKNKMFRHIINTFGSKLISLLFVFCTGVLLVELLVLMERVW